MMTEKPTPFGPWLRRLRIALGLTQAQLAERAGCPVATIRKIEDGEQPPSREMAEALARVLEIGPEDRANFLRAARRTAPLSEAQLPGPAAWAEPQTPLELGWVPRSKLQPPRLPQDRLARRRHIEELRAALSQKRLVLLSAPAGFGKTTLMAAVFETCSDRSTVWLAVDEQDNSPLAFLTALIAAFQRPYPGFGEEVLLALSRQASFAEETGTLPFDPRPANLLILAMEKRIYGDLFIALDDLHTLRDPAIFATLDYLLKRMPPGIHILAGSRYDPPLALAKLRGRGELAEFHPDELRFSLVETAALLNEQHRLGLSGEDINTLYAKTGGWAAGVQLTAGTLRHLAPFSDRSKFLNGINKAAPQIFDLLAEQVLDYQEPDIRSFLVETSILPELTEEACNAVTRRTDSLKILETLYRRNLFLSAIESSTEDADAPPAEAEGDFSTQTTYRYNELFAAFLQHQLRRSGDENWRGAHERAAAVERYPVRAVDHLLKARLFTRAADLLEKEGEDLLRLGYLPSLAAWITALPKEELDAHPNLLYLLGQIAFHFQDLPSAASAYKSALNGFQRRRDGEGFGKVRTAQVGLAFLKSDFASAGEQIQQALECPLAPATRVQLLLERVRIAQFQGNFAQAEADLRTVDDFLEETNELDAWYAFLNGLTPGALAIPGWLEKTSAAIQRTEQYLRAEKQLRSLGKPLSKMPRLRGQSQPGKTFEMTLFQAVIEEQRAVIYLYRGEIEHTLESAILALELGRRAGGRPTWQHWITELMALTAEQILGQESAARERMQRLFEEAWQMMRKNRKSLHVLSGMLYFLGHALWLAGNAAEAQRIYHLVNDLVQDQLSPITQCSLTMFQGLVRLGSAGGTAAGSESGAALETENHEKAARLFQKAVEIESKLPLFNIFGSARVLLAECYRRLGRLEEARREIEAALAECQAQGTPGRILLEGQTALSSLRLVRQGPWREPAERLIHQLEPEETGSQTGFLVPDTGETLTAREIEILSLLTEGFTNQQIADRLFLSLHTVKHHVANVLGKLGVKNRGQAVNKWSEISGRGGSGAEAGP